MARRTGFGMGPYRDLKCRGLAWLFFFISFFFLFLAFNALFMVPSEHPGEYDQTLIGMAVVAIGVALLAAGKSGKLFVVLNRRTKSPYGSILSTPPIMFCGGVLLMFLGLLSCGHF